VKVWGDIGSGEVELLIRNDGTINAVRYIEILEGYLVTCYPQRQEGGGVHKAIMTAERYQDNNIHCLRLPPQSPDLNLIENCWSFLRDKLYEKNTTLKTKDDVWKEACEIWYKIMKNSLSKLYNSMPSRLQEVIDKEDKRISA